MKVFSTRVNKASSKRQRYRSFDSLESLYERCASSEKIYLQRSIRSAQSLRLGQECVSAVSLSRETKHPSSNSVVPHDIAAFLTQNRMKGKRGVKFNDNICDSWSIPRICTRHLMSNSDNKDKAVAMRERDYCEVLGNEFCKACSKIRARKECEDEFDVMYLKPKSVQQKETTRSMTPLSDIVLCKCPPLPQSESKGMFVRLHEFERTPPQYYINPTEGIYSHEQLLNGEVTVKTTSYAGHTDDISRKETSIIQEYTSERETMEPSAALSRFKAVGRVTQATVPYRKPNTFLPELHLREINKQIRSILKAGENKTPNEFVGISRKDSFKDMPIEPPQITVDFALGIFDPKKRQVKRAINYSGNT